MASGHRAVTEEVLERGEVSYFGKAMSKNLDLQAAIRKVRCLLYVGKAIDGLPILRTIHKNLLPKPPRLTQITLFLGDPRQVSTSQMSVDPDVHARKPLRPFQRQDPVPARFRFVPCPQRPHGHDLSVRQIGIVRRDLQPIVSHRHGFVGPPQQLPALGHKGIKLPGGRYRAGLLTEIRPVRLAHRRRVRSSSGQARGSPISLRFGRLEIPTQKKFGKFLDKRFGHYNYS